MNSENTPQQPASVGGRSTLSRLVVRPLVLAFVFVVLVFAVVQATGRMVLAVLHVFEADFNVLLAEQDIRVSKLRGDWQGFNPVVRIEALTAPAFQAANVYFELDLLESIWRNNLVAHRLNIGDIELRAEKTAQGWAIRGLGGESTFNPDVFLRHSDALDLQAQLMLHDLDAAPADLPWLRAQVAMRSEGGQRELRLVLSSSAGGNNEQLKIAARETMLGQLGEDVARSLSVAGSLTVPQVLTGSLSARLDSADIHWRQSDAAGRGAATVSASVMTNLSDAPLQIDLRTTAGVAEAEYVLAINPVARVGDSVLEIDPVYARIDMDQVTQDPQADLFTRLVTGQPTQPMVQIWLRQLNLDAVTQFVAEHFTAWEPAGRWIAALDLKGQADNLHAFVDVDRRFGYAATLSGLQMTGYKGAPTLDGGQGQVWGHPNAVALRLNAQDVDLQFPDLYEQGWRLEYISGVLKGWFGSGYFALQGESLKTQIGSSAVAGEFSLSRPDPRYEQRVGLVLNLDQSGLMQAKQFVPYKIPDVLKNWLETGPQEGGLRNARFAYQGQVHTRPGELGRRIELRADLLDARVRYEPSWPVVSDIQGHVHVAGAITRVDVAAGRSLNLDIGGSRVALRDNGRDATGLLNVRGAADDLLRFVRTSPLQDMLSFVSPDWQMQGRVEARGPITIPLRDDAPELAVGFDFQLADVELSMPEFRSHLSDLAGSGRFDLPHNVTGIFRGRMFDEDTVFRANHTEHQVSFDINGAATPEDVYQLIAYEDTVPVAGRFTYTGQLHLPMQTDHPGAGIPSLHVTSDLVGLQVDLPAEFGKQAQTATPAELDVQFLDAYQAVRWEYEGTTGWLHYAEELERGAVGINANPPMTSTDTQAIVISGQMPRAVLSDWVSDEGESSVALPLDWDIRGLRIDEFFIDELSFADVNLSGSQVGEDVWFSFDSNDLAGSVELPLDKVMKVSLSRLRLPASEEPEETALVGGQPVYLVGVDVGQSLPASQVRIDSLFIEEEPFGRWEFEIVPEVDAATGLNQRLAFVDFAADVNGVHIKDAELAWDLQDNTSLFVGNLLLDDLAQTLPLWDFPAAMSTDKASLAVDGSWSGSPVDISLLGLNGTLAFEARDGRFLEVDAGAGGLQLLSLVNFSKAAKRFSFDFSDVVGEGISFDDLSATVTLQDGQLSFTDRMRLKGSSGAYQLGGQVDLHAGTLDNEMIVTLPVSNSLPWYGVYLALANPLAGLGVLVGERVLRKPLEQFSSAKFSVTGTLDEPQINFVSLWDQSMRESDLDEPDMRTPLDAQVPVNDDTPSVAEQGSGR